MKFRRNELLFFIGQLLFMIRIICVYSSLIELSSTTQNIILFVAEFLWTICIIKNETNYASLIKKLVIISILFVNYRVAHATSLLILFSMLFASEGINERKIIKFLFTFNSTILALLITMYLLNFYMGNALTFTTYRVLDSVKVARHSFYFNQPNGFSMALFFTCLIYVYLNYDKVRKWKLYAIIIGASTFIYIYPNTKTITYIGLLFVVLDILKEVPFVKPFYWLRKYIPMLCMIISIAVLLLLIRNPHGAIGSLNIWLSGRISEGAIALRNLGVPLFGQIVENKSNYSPVFGYYTIYLDNLYFKLLIQYGIVPTVIFIYYSCKAFKYHSKDLIKLLFLTIVFIFGFTEATAIEIFFTFPMLFIRDSIDMNLNLLSKQKQV
ncbi:hypothetical protein ACJDU8_03520 [Clostridium sp. WILCCON 0269]|uniref:Polysaccharide polymerase n=1 Tax=Candidatus Clostridium eludens TaxID=3381663 RepID=A0ABW8SF22_9CLOT